MACIPFDKEEEFDGSNGGEGDDGDVHGGPRSPRRERLSRDSMLRFFSLFPRGLRREQRVKGRICRLP